MLLYAALAAIPLIWLFVAMLILRLPAYKAGVTALFLGILMAFIVWKISLPNVLYALREGVLLALYPILWVIFAAIFTYNLLEKSGAMNIIKSIISNISTDKRVLTLVIAFAFGGFMESIAGFGTSVAIPLSILISLGFEPLLAAVICLTANTIPVAFGVVGIPIITLVKVTGLPLGELTLYTALQLLPLVLVLPFFLVMLTTGSVRGIRGAVAVTIVGGLSFAAGQTLIAWLIGPELSAIVGSLLALAALLLWNRLFPTDSKDIYIINAVITNYSIERVSLKAGLIAWSPYISMLILILATRSLPSSLSFITNPGSIIVISAILGGLLQGLKISTIVNIAACTIRQMLKTIATVTSLVSLSKVMGMSNMIHAISEAISYLTGGLFPLFSPLIGGLGTFLTGSDTSSNILFGELQKQTAIKIGSNASWIAAANASGAAVGKMISPQSISIATTAAALSGKEGNILARTIKFFVICIMVLGLLVYFIGKVI